MSIYDMSRMRREEERRRGGYDRPELWKQRKEETILKEGKEKIENKRREKFRLSRDRRVLYFSHRVITDK